MSVLRKVRVSSNSRQTDFLSRSYRLIMRILKNNYFKFTLSALLYSVWVMWTGYYWLLTGLIIMADFFIFKLVPWEFWRKIKNKWLRRFFEWLQFFFLALILVMFVRAFFYRSYYIPTDSMENTLLPGDYIFVNKIKYGPRMPMRPLSIPFMHNTIPFGEKKKSYSNKIKIPYQKLPGFSEIKQNDIVVFNFPEGDTILHPFTGHSYYSEIRKWGRKYVHDKFEIRTHPIVKRENFIKRCVAIPGDVIEIKKGTVFTNNHELNNSGHIKLKYYIKTSAKKVEDLFSDSIQPVDYKIISHKDNILFESPLSADEMEQLNGHPQVIGIMKHENTNYTLSTDKIFPHRHAFKWTEDNFGPLYVPKKGTTIRLSPENLPLYERIIKIYEKNDMEIKKDSVFINGKHTRVYTFKMNYYFLLGDNRHYSLDSRYWGLVPKNHVEGKAEFIWFSFQWDKTAKNGKIRWNRMLKKIK